MLLGVALALCANLPAQAQVEPTSLGSLTNLPALVNTATSSNQVSVIPVSQGSGIAVAAAITASAAGASNATYYWLGSVNGTDFGTVAFKTNYLPMTGTTLARGTFVFTPAELSGLRAISLGTIQNPHTTAILTNRGVIWSKPN